MSDRIEADLPTDWKALQSRVALILSECGYRTEIDRTITLARGEADIDVYAEDPRAVAPVVLIECKHWKRAVPRNVVRAFHEVVGNAGANLGLVVSRAGAQGGAFKAAEYTNLKLVDWEGFEDLFVERWIENHLIVRLREDADPLLEYTEPINSRIFRKADALPPERRAEFKALRARHWLLARLILPLVAGLPIVGPEPMLPFRPRMASLPDGSGTLPDAVADTTALRSFLDATIAASRDAITEFDAVFGERA